MTSSTSSSQTEQLHEFAFPPTDGEVDLDHVSTEDLTRFVTMCLGVLADRRVAGQQ